MQMSRRLFLWGSLGVVIIAAAATLYLRQPPSVDGAVPLPTVAITSPLYGSEFMLGSPVVVDVEANAGVPITGLELWIDGQLLGYQELSGEGPNLGTASFLWSPSTIAVHALAARALGVEGPLATSDTVHVAVTEMMVEEGMMDTVDHAGPAVLPAANKAYPISGPGPEASISPAQPMKNGGANLPGSQASGKPAAPEILAEAQACSTKLTIHDLSSDEEGFEVFRQGSNAQAWGKVATLDNKPGTGWLEYVDDASPGGFTYYVASYNEAGNSPSNIVLINIDPADCAQKNDDTSALEVDLTQLLGENPADRYYCYQSFDSMHWSRLPADGFFMPDGVGNDGQDVISLANYVPSAEDMTLQLLLECWGWQGGALQKLGDFTHSFDLSDLSTLPSQITNAALDGVIKKLDGVSGGFYPLSGDLGDISVGVWKGFPMVDPTMPFINAKITYNPDDCKTHLMPDAQNLFGQVLFCTPFPGFDSGDGGTNPQPYLVWDFQASCPAGFGFPPCNDLGYWMDLAQANDGEVFFIVWDWSTAGTELHTVTPADLSNLTIKPKDCSGPRSFMVSMRYRDADETLLGQTSNVVSIDCPKALPWEIPLDISYDTITFSDLDDGESDPDDVEVYGYVKAWVPGGQTRFMNLAEWDEQDGHCPDESVEWPGSLNSQGLLITDGCTKIFDDGTHNLSSYAVCQGTTKENCSISGWNFENNVTRINAVDGSGMWLYLTVYDWDDASANDLQCWSIIELKPRTRFEWAQIQDYNFGFIGFDQGNGNCTVSGHINAVLP